MPKFLQFFCPRILRKKICEKFTQVFYNENNYHDIIQIPQINYFPKKGKKRKLQNPPLLIQYSGYLVKNLPKVFIPCF